MYRIRKAELRYKSDRVKENKCPFCDPDPKVIIKTGKDFLVVRNMYNYNLWDRKKVIDHLMIIPKKHIHGLEELPKDLYEEYMNLLLEYSKEGYDSFTRAASSIIKTQPHLHTHLIKTKQKKYNVVHFNDEPYYLFFK